MADGQLEWVFDSLVEFLRGPIWNIPVLTFIEQKSVVFEPGAENEEELTKIHEAYKNLVDFMLGSYMEDLRITPEEFEKSCSVATKKALNQFHQNLFQQVWAADDFEIFKRMMTQKNLELQLQALEFLTQKRGSVPNCMEPNNDMKDDERAMEEIIKKAIGAICEESASNEEEAEQLASADVALKEKMKQEAQKEKELLEQAIQHKVKDPDADTVDEPEQATEEISVDEQEKATEEGPADEPPEQATEENLVNDEDVQNGVEHDTEEPEAEPTPEDTSQPDEDAVEQASDSNSTPEVVDEKVQPLPQLPKLSLHGSLPPIEQPKSVAKLSPLFMEPEESTWSEGDATIYEEKAQVEVTAIDMEKRQNYLRQQRDRILAMKKQERSRRLSNADEVITQGRPKSAKAAKQVLREETTEVDPHTLAFRKTLAAKLRSEVIDRND